MADFYAILGISHAAEADEIAKAYRRAALTYNPESNQQAGTEDRVELARRFRLVSQAYTVLADAKLRAIYDAYGESGVRHGGTFNDKQGLDIDAIDSDAVFRRFFGVDNPFQIMGDVSGLHSTQHHFFSESAAAKAPDAAQPVPVPTTLTLEEVATGSLKTVSWTGRDATPQTIDVAVPAGIEHGNSIVVPAPGGSVRVVVSVAPHDVFMRKGADLYFTTRISLADALTGTNVVVPLLNGRTTSLCVDEVVNPDFSISLHGEGLPDPKAGGKRGDLIVKFATQYPAYLTAEQKRELRRVLTQP